MQDLTPMIQKGDLPPCVLCQMRALGVCAKAGDDALAELERHKIYRTYRHPFDAAHEVDVD